MNLSVIWYKKMWRNFATTSVFSVFLFPYQKFSETPKEFPKKLFASVRPKIFDGRTWYPLSIQEMFSLPEALWKMELNPKKVYGNVKQKKSTEKPDIPLSHPYKFFAARTSLKPRRVPKNLFGNMRPKFWQNFEIPPVLSIYFFNYQKLSQTTKRSQ